LFVSPLVTSQEKSADDELSKKYLRTILKSDVGEKSSIVHDWAKSASKQEIVEMLIWLSANYQALINFQEDLKKMRDVPPEGCNFQRNKLKQEKIEEISRVSVD